MEEEVGWILEPVLVGVGDGKRGEGEQEVEVCEEGL